LVRRCTLGKTDRFVHCCFVVSVHRKKIPNNQMIAKAFFEHYMQLAICKLQMQIMSIVTNLVRKLGKPIRYTNGKARRRLFLTQPTTYQSVSQSKEVMQSGLRVGTLFTCHPQPPNQCKRYFMYNCNCPHTCNPNS